jgi:polysaccharide deacetylase 2 family uncharacterized protein YibQ
MGTRCLRYERHSGEHNFNGTEEKTMNRVLTVAHSLALEKLMPSEQWDAVWEELRLARLAEDERHQSVMEILDEQYRLLLMHQPFKPIIMEKTLRCLSKKHS